MLLDDDSAEFTSFYCPPWGQFKFTRTSQLLDLAHSNFQRMMELAMTNLHNIIVYFVNLLVHTKTHEEHLSVLEKVFARLRQCNLRLTPQDILPGIDKLQCVREAPPPSSDTQIKQFLGRAIFFEPISAILAGAG